MELRSKPKSAPSGANYTLIGLGVIAVGAAVAVGVYLSRKK